MTVLRSDKRLTDSPSILRGGHQLGPLIFFLLAMAVLVAVLVALRGPLPVAQTTINGLVTGAYFALGAAGLTLVFGILRLINFAHGDLLTFGAYIALATVYLGLPFWVAVIASVLITAATTLGFEAVIWDPLRRRGAGTLQMILTAIGLAFILRHGIQLIAGTNPQTLGVDVVSTFNVGPLTIGQTQAWVLIAGYLVLVLLGVMLRFSLLGKQLRALSDDLDLAEVTGIDSDRLILITQALSGGLAGLAGILFAASVGSITPNVGFFLLISLFSATILGGVGNAYGALVGGIALGLVQEWSTLVLDARWKTAIGFVVLVAMIIIRPTGLLGQKRLVDR